MSRKTALIVAGSVLLSGCGVTSQGQNFDLPASEAKQILLQTEVPYDVLGSPDLRAYAVAEGRDTVVWRVLLQDAEYMRFAATITSSNPASTHVVVSVSGPPSGRYAAMGQALNENASVKNLYLAAMQEEVAAALEKRDFNIIKVSPQLLAAIAANMGSISVPGDDAPTPDSDDKVRADKEQAAIDRELAAWNAGEPDDEADWQHASD
jgi:hypothetical protein